MTIEHGERGSPTFIRIYDKAAERGLTDGSHWIRAEIEFRKDRAKTLAKRFAEYGEDSIKKLYLGVITNYLRYVVPNEHDSNNRRWEMTDYWARFVGAAERVQLFENLGTEYNMRKLENFVIKQAGNAIATYIEIKGVDAFLDDLKGRTAKINPKYTELKAKYKPKS